MKTVFNNPLKDNKISLDPCTRCRKPGWFYLGHGALFCADCTTELFAVFGEAISQPTPDLPGRVGSATAGAAASAGFSLSHFADDLGGSGADVASQTNFANDGERSQRNRSESDAGENQNLHFNSSSLISREGNVASSDAPPAHNAVDVTTISLDAGPWLGGAI